MAVKVFVSWSGEKSKAVATAFRDWLPDVLQGCEPWMSDIDIEAGVRWNEEIGSKLDSYDFGLICVTRWNQHRPWLNFEAGAIGKLMTTARVVPLAIDLSAGDVAPPLGNYQAKTIARDEIFDVLKAINAQAYAPLDQQRLENAFKKWWPELEGTLDDLPEDPAPDQTGGGSPASPTEHVRSERDLLEEILRIARADGAASPVRPAGEEWIMNAIQQIIEKWMPEISGWGVSYSDHRYQLTLGEPWPTGLRDDLEDLGVTAGVDILIHRV